MAVGALTIGYVLIGTATTGGTAPGGASAPTGCTISGTTGDISQWVTDIEATPDIASVSATNFGGGGFTQQVPGLKSAGIVLGINQDYAASAINVLLGNNGTISTPGATAGFFIEIRQTSAARSATNPGFIAKVIHLGHSAFKAKVGEIPSFGLKLGVTGGFAELVA